MERPALRPSRIANSFTGFKADPGISRAISSGIGARIGQDIRRSQDISAYGRNPMGWHGVRLH
jgi:hypothetical protein